MFDIFHKALETAILYTLKWCCLTCDGGGNEPNPADRCHCVALFKAADYKTIISKIGDIECGDWNFPLDVQDKKHYVFWRWWDAWTRFRQLEQELIKYAIILNRTEES